MRDSLGSAIPLPASFGIVLLALGALITLQIRARGSLRLSKDAYFALVALASPLGIGLIFGTTACIVAFVVSYGALGVFARTPRIPEPQELEALRLRAHIDLKAAKRLNGILRQEMKGHELMRQSLPTLPPDKRPAAEALIQQHEEQTRLELQQLEGTIRLLKAGNGAA